ncbi:TetR/AcrR family transcriptional regulator [Actinomadura sp. 9N215]|uniref:TetR/AcrR family transcriptional regulator n=1 Tax=Actinomadura sp. 9N215 TaxID=3375150 RepID=UPI003798B581
MGSEGPLSPAQRSGRTGRRAGPTETRDDIIRAARRLFGERGYDGTTLRAIATEANVDAALIHHFFGSKQRVFTATVDELFEKVAMPSGPRVEAGERLVREFLRIWEEPDTGDALRAIFSSSLSHGEAARLFGEIVMVRLVGPTVAEARPPDPHLCLEILSSQLVGTALLRYIVLSGPLTDSNSLVRSMGRYFQGFLDGQIRAADFPRATP